MFTTFAKQCLKSCQHSNIWSEQADLRIGGDDAFEPLCLRKSRSGSS